MKIDDDALNAERYCCRLDELVSLANVQTGDLLQVYYESSLGPHYVVLAEQGHVRTLNVRGHCDDFYPGSARTRVRLLVRAEDALH